MATAAKKMDERELRELIDRRIANSIGSSTSGDRVTKERLQAMRYYKGEPFGDEVEGSSKVVSRDVAEAVDSMLPSFMKIFFGGDRIVEFEPTSEADEDAAKQASDYVNWIITQQNDGYTLLETWFKDALLQKLGTVKAWWEDETHRTRETYEGLTEAEYQQLTADPDLVEISCTKRPDPDADPAAIPSPAGQPGAPTMAAPGLGATAPGAPLLAPPSPPSFLYDCVFERQHDVSRARVAAVPPDETLIDRQAGATDLPWANRRKLTIGRLIEEYPAKKAEILALPAGDSGQNTNQERLERFSDEGGTVPRDSGTDTLGREVWVVDAYVEVDFDGTGRAQMRKVTVAGDGQFAQAGIVLDNEPYDDNPFACLSPVLLPHKLIGMSVADQTMDLQRIKSTLVRQSLDNLYRQNGTELFVKGRVDIDALLNRRPGNVIRGDADSEVVPIPAAPVLAEALTAIQYFDGVRDQRTGAARFTAGPGADVLQSAFTQTATGADMVESASQERIEHIARRFAETGVKRLFRRVLELVCKHQDQPRKAKLGGKWVEIDPSTWNTRWGLTVSVGLGTGNRTHQLATIGAILAKQELILQTLGPNNPLVPVAKYYRGLTRFVQAGGFRSGDEFFSDPGANPIQPPPPQPTPDKLAELQAQSAEKDKDRQLDAQKTAATLASQERTAALNAQVTRESNLTRAAVDNKAIDVDATLKAVQHDTESAFKTHEAGRQVAADQREAFQADREHAFKAESAHADRQVQAESAAAKPAPAAAKVAAAPPAIPKPRRLTGITLHHDAGRLVAATKHFEDGADMIPINRGPAPASPAP